MADIVLGSAERIFKLANEIKKAVDAAKQNTKDCAKISERAADVSTHLKRLTEETTAMEDPSMEKTLKSMEEYLESALELVEKCKGKNVLLRCLTAIDMSEELRVAQEDISHQMGILKLAAQVDTRILLEKQRPTPQQHQQDAGLVETWQSTDSGTDQARMENIHKVFDSLESILGGRESPRNLKLPFLQFITKNFSDELIIGIGGCGVVYKGVLRNQIIAVKRLLNIKTIDDKMFHGEVKSMMMVNHKNVVRFLGYCSHTEEQALKMEGKLIMAQDRERLLCFEYLINGSLESYLTDELRGLEWQTRYQIIKGICDGLHHLHYENHIVHMDLKPANILLDSNMVPKITDFGLSRLDNISRTMSSERLVSLGYCAPEYLCHGKMSAKSDIYSLGVIILELVTGSKEDPNITKVHRRWKHRWNKTAKDAQLGYKQVATCLDLVVRCIRIDPTHRPNIWDIISYLNEMDSSDAKISDGTECLELDDMLGVEPLEIHLPLELNMQISRSVELTNDTDDHFAFRVSTTSLRPYCIEENEGTIPPRSKCSVTISMQALDKALPCHQCRDEFCVQSTRVDGSLAATNIGGDIFNEGPGKVIDTVNFSVVLIEASSPSADH